MRTESQMSRPSQSQEGDSEPRVCNVCHLAYTGDECPICRAEREHAAAVIEERGRRHTQKENGDQEGE
jgi:recombinational DNA repair protein RecR